MKGDTMIGSQESKDVWERVKSNAQDKYFGTPESQSNVLIAAAISELAAIILTVAKRYGT
jgi:hypothetical protein